MDKKALFKIGYGLYLVTAKDDNKQTGFIANTVMQVTDNPLRVAVCINKSNYTYEVVKNTGKMCVNCLDQTAPFGIFEMFGFVSGRDTDKFDGLTHGIASNGVAYLKSFVNAVICLEVENFIDLDSHGMFICTVTDAFTQNDKPSMTYDYYHKNVKPKPQKVKGYVCKICGYVYEGDPLPEDFICPLCKHPASDFERIV